MAEDVGDQEHLDQAVADPVEIDIAGCRTERQVLSKQLPARLLADYAEAAPPDAQLTLEQAGQGEGERLGGLVGGVVVDLRRRPVEELVHRRGFAEPKLGVDRQGVQAWPDQSLEQAVGVRLEDPRKIVAGAHIKAPSVRSITAGSAARAKFDSVTPTNRMPLGGGKTERIRARLASWIWARLSNTRG